jgi:hypothetical protein
LGDAKQIEQALFCYCVTQALCTTSDVCITATDEFSAVLQQNARRQCKRSLRSRSHDLQKKKKKKF